MPIHFDNLKVGRWYAIADMKQPPPGQWNNFQVPVQCHDGHPVQVLEKNWPFMLAQSASGKHLSFDCRVYSFTTVSNKYLRKWYEMFSRPEITDTEEEKSE